jgi:hypothetical protein
VVIFRSRPLWLQMSRYPLKVRLDKPPSDCLCTFEKNNFLTPARNQISTRCPRRYSNGHRRNFRGGGKGANTPLNIFFHLGIFSGIKLNNGKQNKGNEKLTFCGTNFPLFQVWLLCKINFLISLVSFAPPPPSAISQVTLMVTELPACCVSVKIVL